MVVLPVREENGVSAPPLLYIFSAGGEAPALAISMSTGEHSALRRATMYIERDRKGSYSCSLSLCVGQSCKKKKQLLLCLFCILLFDEFPPGD